MLFRMPSSATKCLALALAGSCILIATQAVQAGTVAYYRFENSLSLGADETGNHPGTPTNGPTHSLSVGQNPIRQTSAGNAGSLNLDFAAPPDHISVPYAAALDRGNNPWTIEALVSFDTVPTTVVPAMWIVQKKDLALDSLQDYAFLVAGQRGAGVSGTTYFDNGSYTATGRNLQVEFGNGTTTTWAFRSNLLVPATGWAHVSAAYDGDKTVRFTLDTNLTDNTIDSTETIVATSAVVPNVNAGTLCIGAKKSTSTAVQGFDGLLDEVRISNTWLNLDQLLTAQAGLPGDITTNLVGWWTFDESIGIWANDGTMNGNNVTLRPETGGPTWIAGKRSNALSFDGIDDRGWAFDDFSTTLDGDLTIALWVKFDGTDAGRLVMLDGVGAYAGDNLEMRLYDTEGKFGLDNSSGVLVESKSVGTCNSDTWRHLVITRSGSPNPTFKFYLDGAPDSIHGGVAGWAVSTVGKPRLAYKDNDRTKVSLDDFRIYNRALSDADVLKLYNTELVATPQFSPENGAHEGSSVAVTVTCATADATIHYTVDGSIPTELSPTVASGSTVAVPLPGALRAKAWKITLAESAFKSSAYAVQTVVDTPTFSPDGGTHAGPSVDVTVSCATAGATIHYTLDGTDPTELSPTVVSGGTVTVTLPGTLKAKAWKTGLTESAVKTSLYELAGSITTGMIAWWPMDQSSGASATDVTGNGNTITLSGGPTWTVGAVNNALSFDGTDDTGSMSGNLSTTLSGAMTLALWVQFDRTNDGRLVILDNPGGSDVEFKLNGDGSFGLDNTGGIPSPGVTSAGVIDGSWHHIAITRSADSLPVWKVYLDGALDSTHGGVSGWSIVPLNKVLQVGGKGTNLTKAGMDDLRLYNRELEAGEVGMLYSYSAAARPEFSPDGGEYEGVSVNVTVTCLTAGATIHYTTDGTDPTESSPTVASGGTVAVPLPGTLKAKAWKTGIEPSPVKSTFYERITTVSTPAFSPDDDFHLGGSVDVTVTCATAGATIHYTLDSTDPTELSPTVASGGTVAVPVPGVLKAKAWKTGLTASEVKSSSYQVAGATVGLIAWWKLDEAAGAVANDGTGNGNTVDLSNGPSWVSGAIVSALSFDGSNDYGLKSTALSTSLDGDMTIALWVNSDTTDAGRFLMLGTLEMRSYSDGKFGLDNAGGSGIPAETKSTGICADGTWHHIAVTRSGSPNPTWRLYRDGALETTAGGTSSWTVATFSSPLTLGRKGSSYTKIVMDDIRIYNRDLPPSEVSKLIEYNYHGDFDRNGYINAADLDVFEACASGPAIPYAGNCAEPDFDNDSDVDMDDFGVFQQCYSGPSLVADPACLPILVYPEY